MAVLAYDRIRRMSPDELKSAQQRSTYPPRILVKQIQQTKEQARAVLARVLKPKK